MSHEPTEPPCSVTLDGYTVTARTWWDLMHILRRLVRFRGLLVEPKRKEETAPEDAGFNLVRCWFCDAEGRSTTWDAAAAGARSAVDYLRQHMAEEHGVVPS